MPHIPSAPIAMQSLCKFEQCLTMAKTGSHIYDTEKWLFLPDFYCDYRYVLGTCGKKPLICIGINPSTAAPDALDNTLKSVDRIAHANGFDSFLMMNVSAQRATSPADMDREPNLVLHEENMKAFSYVLDQCPEEPTIWAAWGTILTCHHYLTDYLADMIITAEHAHAHWVTAGPRSKAAGHPHHPLYLKKTAQLEAFDILKYKKGLVSAKR